MGIPLILLGIESEPNVKPGLNQCINVHLECRFDPYPCLNPFKLLLIFTYYYKEFEIVYSHNSNFMGENYIGRNEQIQESNWLPCKQMASLYRQKVCNNSQTQGLYTMQSTQTLPVPSRNLSAITENEGTKKVQNFNPKNKPTC